MQKADVIRTLKNAGDDYFKFLYLSPERLESYLFKEYLPSLNVNLIAVDEAHCISQWGYDFRPSYLRIAELRKELPEVPVLALTASATPDVQEDICTQLQFDSTTIFRSPFERKNLSYHVLKADSKFHRLAEIIKKIPGSGIVYCKSRKRTQEVAQILQMQGIAASYYHAGLDTDQRSLRQQEWITNKNRIIVCTNAFGMGIDKPDVRMVAHVDVPDCLENYYQEAGRAGRDGKKAYAILLYNEKELDELSNLHLTRFPDIKQIRQVYHALVNFLQIPVHSGIHVNYLFRFDQFVKNYKLEAPTTLYALKALEQDGWLDFNEKNFMPSTVVFTTSKNGLYEFQHAHPAYEQLLTTLLRTYEGIFDFPAFISETLLSRLLRTDEAEIKRLLKTISSFAIIHYVPQNDAPGIIFRKNRVATSDLLLNTTQYNKRKKIFIQRTDCIISYIKTPECRSRFINHYFGDRKFGNCGICDQCTAKKTSDLTSDEFELINKAITQILSTGQRSVPEVLKELTDIKSEKAWQVIEVLQSENKIKATLDGKLQLTDARISSEN